MNNKSKLASIIDTATLIFCYFVLAMLICCNFTNSFIIQIFLSIIIAFFLNWIIKKLYFYMTKQKKLKFKTQNEICEILNAFQNSDPQKLFKFFFDAMSKKYSCRENGSLNSFFCKINNLNILFYFNFYYKISVFDIINLISTYKNWHQLFIFTRDIDPVVKNYVSNNKNIKIFDAEKTYFLLKHLNTYPKIKESNKKHNIKQTINYAFIKSNAKVYLKLALLFIFSSLILSYAVYYRVFASIMIVCVIICLIKPQQNNTPEKMFFEQ